MILCGVGQPELVNRQRETGPPSSCPSWASWWTPLSHLSCVL